MLFNLRSLKERTIWKKFQGGDHSSFKEIYSLYSRALYAFGMKIAKDETIVSECLQSLFIYLWEKRSSIACPSDIFAYLAVSLKHRILKEINPEQPTVTVNETAINGDELENTSYFILDTDVQNSSETENQKAVALNNALQSLSSRQKEALYLRYYDGLSVDEAAEVMGLNNQTMRNVTSNAIKRLKADRALLKAIKAI